MKIAIIGGGIAGLVSAYQLYQHQIDFVLLEARPRLGGRILTTFADKRPTTPLDYGPTWFWDDHLHVKRLLRELRIRHFPQYTKGMSIYDNGQGRNPHQFTAPETPPAFRVVGGMQMLIEKLYRKLPDEKIHLNTEVTQVVADEDGIAVQAIHEGKTCFYDVDYVIVALPPNLASSLISYHPRLPSHVVQALESTHTWMGHAMKVFVVYDTPFWKQTGLSGHGISHYGVVGEIHDASPADMPFGVLFGFLGNHSKGRNMSPADRQEAVIDQIKRMYGWQARNYVHYADFNWAYEHYTAGSFRSESLSHSHSQYGNPILQEPMMQGRLFWGASEVSTVSGGYVDGAIYRAKEIVESILEKTKAGS